MGEQENAEKAAFMAARDLGIGTILFRNALAKKLELNLTESLCLTLLGIRGRLSPSELARVIGLATGSVTTMLDRLEKRGYIRRIPNSLDRRGVLVELTELYAGDSRPLVEGVQTAHRELLRSYSTEELSVIADFLRKFTANLRDNAEDLSIILGA